MLTDHPHCFTVLLAALGAVLLLSTANAQPPERRVISLPWGIYRHFPADFSRWNEAATGFAGWDSEVRELDLSRTCLVLMHLPNTGLTVDTEFGPDTRSPDALGTVEWVPRTIQMVAFRLPPLVKAARDAGLLVAHVSGADGAGPVWEACLAEVGDPPPPDADRIPVDQERWARHMRDVFDLPRETRPEVTYPLPELDFSDAWQLLQPQEGDVCASQAWQLCRLLRNRGVDHILYCGWALNWCLWFSPGGMCDMSRKGYLCSAVRGGCVAIENKESAVGERNLEYAYWKTSTMFGYVFDLHDLTHALRDYARGREGEG